MLTIVAARFSDLSTPAMFLVSALIGSAVELATGWLMEILGAVAWDYSHLPGSFGRSDLGFTLVGALACLDALPPLIYRLVESGLEKHGRSILSGVDGVHGLQHRRHPPGARAQRLTTSSRQLDRTVHRRALSFFPGSETIREYEHNACDRAERSLTNAAAQSILRERTAQSFAVELAIHCS
ncbi:MAG: putative ABC transporter permease [Eggerthella lenta]